MGANRPSAVPALPHPSPPPHSWRRGSGGHAFARPVAFPFLSLRTINTRAPSPQTIIIKPRAPFTPAFSSHTHPHNKQQQWPSLSSARSRASVPTLPPLPPAVLPAWWLPAPPRARRTARSTTVARRTPPLSGRRPRCVLRERRRRCAARALRTLFCGCNARSALQCCVVHTAQHTIA